MVADKPHSTESLATDLITEPPTTPTAKTERIVVLDVLRGVATLGILIMNIQSFSMISSAYFNPTAYGNLE